MAMRVLHRQVVSSYADGLHSTIQALPAANDDAGDQAEESKIYNFGVSYVRMRFQRSERAWRLLLTKTGSVAMRNMACDYIMVPWMLIVFIGTSSIAFLYAPARGVWICDDDRSGE